MFSFKRLIRLSYFIVATRADRLFPDYYWLLNIVLTSHIVLVYGRAICLTDTANTASGKQMHIHSLTYNLQYNYLFMSTENFLF